VRGPVAGASPNLNFVLGFKRGINRCLETAVSNPVTLCQIGGSVPAATFKNAAALAAIVATGRVFALGAVMQDLQNDINGSPDPYQAGIRYGRRFCIWMGPPSPLRGRRRRARTRWQQPLEAVLHRFGSTAASTRRSAAPRECNPWLPQFTRANCGGNCGYVVRAVDNALGGRSIVLPRRVHSRQFTGIYATSLGPACGGT
jgi:hypothetical protein